MYTLHVISKEKLLESWLVNCPKDRLYDVSAIEAKRQEILQVININSVTQRFIYLTVMTSA
jgi:hypothetical protein